MCSRGGEAAKWQEFAPNVPEVDLTQLQGANAQEIWGGNLDPGIYTKLFIYVDQVNGVLKKTEEMVDVKLPSNKLQISVPFEVSATEVTSFVYDLTVVAAGSERAGRIKYILKPQIGQSGAGKKLSLIKGPKMEGALKLKLEGEADHGQEVSLLVTSQGKPVEGAVVTLNDAEIGATNAEGRINVVIPEDAEGVRLTATIGEFLGELEIEFPEVKGEERPGGDRREGGQPESGERGQGDDRGAPSGQDNKAAEDTTPPVITITDVSDGATSTEPFTIVFSAADDVDPAESLTVTATLNGAPFVSGTQVSDVGSYTLVIIAVDTSGNEADAEVEFEIVKP